MFTIEGNRSIELSCPVIYDLFSLRIYIQKCIENNFPPLKAQDLLINFDAISPTVYYLLSTKPIAGNKATLLFRKLPV